MREDLFRIDHNINDKWSLFGHFIHDAVSQNYATVLWNNDNYPTVGSNFGNPSYSSVIKLTGALKPNVLLEAAFNYDGNKIAILPVAEGGGSFAKPSGWSAGTYFTGPECDEPSAQHQPEHLRHNLGPRKRSVDERRRGLQRNRQPVGYKGHSIN